MKKSNFNDFLNSIKQYGDNIALHDHNSNTFLTYNDLHKKSEYFAKRIDVKKGERVIIYDLAPMEWTMIFFALQIIGAVAVPLDKRVDKSFIDEVVSLTKPVMIISNSFFVKNLTCETYQSLLNREGREGNIVIDNHGPAQILFTSGTWSQPKGVTLSQGNILSNVQQILSVYPSKKAENVLAILPLAHSYQQTLGLLAPLKMGSKIVFVEPSSSYDITEAIQRHNVEVIPVVPRILELIQSSILRKVRNRKTRALLRFLIPKCRYLPIFFRRAIFKSVHAKIGGELKVMISGGAPLAIELDRFFQGLGYKVYVGYGMTECSPIITACFNQNRKTNQVGKALPAVKLEVSKTGEIIVGGESVFLGYWPNIRKGKFCTGDIGFLSKNGELVLSGRSKNLIIFSNGEKCFCEDLEKVVDAVEHVEHSCAIEINSQEGVKVQVIYCTEENIPVDEMNVLDQVKKVMPMGIRLSGATQVPQDIFPRTHTMKIDRGRALKVLESQQGSAEADSTSKPN